MCEGDKDENGVVAICTATTSQYYIYTYIWSQSPSPSQAVEKKKNLLNQLTHHYMWKELASRYGGYYRFGSAKFLKFQNPSSHIFIFLYIFLLQIIFHK